MPIVTIDKDHVSIDQILKEFKRQCERSGLYSEMKKRRHFIKPSEQRRAAKLAARKKLLKKLRKEQQRMRRMDWR